MQNRNKDMESAFVVRWESIEDGAENLELQTRAISR